MMITIDVLKNSASNQANLTSAIRRADLAIILGAPAQVVNPLIDTIEKNMDLSSINNINI